MKLKATDVVAARTRLPINWFLGICLAAFWPIISASAAVPPPSAEELNPAEKWVVERVTADKEADLSSRFPEEKDRKLSAHFLEDLLTGARPDVTLHRHGVQIKGACIDEPIDLESARIPCEVQLDNCIFKGPVDFRGADVAHNFRARGARFQNEKKGGDFSGMKVRGDADFSGAMFKGTAVFSVADIGGNFEAQRAHFQSKARALFLSIKVGGEARFEAGVVFSRADIAGSFDAANARFENEANFWRLRVGAYVFFSGAFFEQQADFLGADIAGDLIAEGAHFQSRRAARFSSAKVGGEAVFTGARFGGALDLRYADFGLLDLSNASWSQVAARIQMQGTSYKYIRAVGENEPKSHRAVLELVDQSPYTADVYGSLEAFFLRQGYRADADEAFIAGKVPERKEYFRSGDWFGWLRSWMLDLLVGYGRQPWRAGIPCAVLVALGCVLFPPKKMEPQNPEDTPRVYNRFWYSLGLFLPFVDLQSNKVWKPKADQTLLRNYMRVHILLGWILVPLVLAAVTGLIK